MTDFIRFLSCILAGIIVFSVLSDPLDVLAAKKCLYYSTYTGDCGNDAVSGGSYCKTHTCMESGCFKKVNGGNERCATCKDKYYYDLGITSPTCNDSGCNANKAEGSFYCSSHTCSHGSCTSKKVSGSRYCSSHTCERGRMGCYNEVASANAKCDSCKKKSSSSKSTTNTTKTSTKSSSTKKSTSTKKTTSSKSSSKSKSKVSLPDCDDYDTFDDFMDDWDGYMPGGIDAEDYWENW